MRVFESTVARYNICPQEEITQRWRKVCDGLYNLCCSKNIIEVMISGKMGLTCHVACMSWVTNAYRTLAGNREGRRQLVSSGCKWENDIIITVDQILC
jgi:hypothetical protein